MEWKTASQQHLSNYIWWHVGILGKPISFAAVQVTELIERFKNRILPYRPIPWYNDELDHLISKGVIYYVLYKEMVKGFEVLSGAYIVIYKDKVIGEVLPSSHSYFSHLKT